MNIAVVINKDMSEGGAFQYALSMSALLKNNGSDKYRFTFFTTVRGNVPVLKAHGIASAYLPWSNFDRFMNCLPQTRFIGNIFSALKLKLELKLDRLFKKHGIDLVYFLAPTDMALGLSLHNYIFTVWDVCFLSNMEFPEVYANMEFERRDELYRAALSKAVAVVTDSAHTATILAGKYGVEKKRVVLAGLLPSGEVAASARSGLSDAIDINEKYKISGRYIFYPAQFWPHKNHIYILRGMKMLKEKHGLKLTAVFAGSDKGNLRYILSKAKEFGIDDQVRHIGFVDDKELPHLYSRALALVMPTYFGPTNIPPLEAFAMGCPVLYSDLPGLAGNIKESVILLDLTRPESMCDGLLKIAENSGQVKTMVDNGRRFVRSVIGEDRWTPLKAVFDSYLERSRCRSGE